MYGGGSLLEMELLKDVRLKLDSASVFRGDRLEEFRLSPRHADPLCQGTEQ